MMSVWWPQVKAVIRLELKKTFLARRGLWIYLVAALPVLLFIAYAVVTSTQQNRSANVARRTEKQLTYQDLLAVKAGLAATEVGPILVKQLLTVYLADN